MGLNPVLSAYPEVVAIVSTQGITIWPFKAASFPGTMSTMPSV